MRQAGTAREFRPFSGRLTLLNQEKRELDSQLDEALELIASKLVEYSPMKIAVIPFIRTSNEESMSLKNLPGGLGPT